MGVAQVGRGKRRLPIMQVNDLGSEGVDYAKANVRGDAGKRRETARIIRPIKPVGAEVGIAGPLVEMRRIDREQVETGRGAREDARRSAKQIIVGVRSLRVDKFGQNCRIAWDERSDLDV